MAGYREHITVSGLLGVGYGFGAAIGFGFSPVQGALAGCLTGVAGMLPDLDAQSGRPVRELFSLTAAVVPIMLMERIVELSGSFEGTMLVSVLLYAAIRFGGAAVLAKLAVHRGMFHSIPALLIAAQTAFLCYKSDDVRVKLLMSAGVALGFLSHLILDEMYSVQWSGIRLKLNKAAGSAVKVFAKSAGANLVAFGLLAFVTYASLVDAGVVEQHDQIKQLLRHANSAIIR